MSEHNSGAAPSGKVEQESWIGRGALSISARLVLLLMAAAISTTDPAKANSDDRIEPYRAAREAYINDFRVNGKHDPAQLIPLEHNLQFLVNQSGGEVQAQALFELGSVQRLANKFPVAVSTLTKAAELATQLGRSDITFDSWIGIARAHTIGTHDHGAAEAAMARASAAADANPSAKQRFEIAHYNAERSAARGETEAGLVGALNAVRLAPEPHDRFYAELDTGDALEKMAKSCDYRQLRDKRSADDRPGDPWGGCRRAISAAQSEYERAAHTADGLGWKWLASQARQFIRNLEVRRWLVEQRAHSVPSAVVKVFAARDKKDVLVERGDFARRMLLGDRKGIGAEQPVLTAAIEQALAEADKAPGGEENPSSLYLRGVLQEMRGGNAGQAAELYARAAALLTAQRAGFFDPRRRGTVIESNGEIFRDLALRLLALHHDADAFAALESVRARGLGEMQQALAQKDVTDADRGWLSELLRLEAESSALEAGIVEHVIGDGSLDGLDNKLVQWEKGVNARSSYLLRQDAIRNRFARTRFSPVSLPDLEQAAKRNRIPVILYWIANPNIIVWYVGPNGSELRTVFLPEAELERKITQVVGTINQPTKTFDKQTAKELYLYLIAPFEDLLEAKQIMIIPQGPIVGLPFEALVQPTGDFLIDRWTVSYAPNATIAYEALQRPVPKITQVTGILDPELIDTREQEGIGSVSGLRLQTLSSSEVLPDKLSDSLRGAESAHLLLHGEFDPIEPLRSRLIENSHRSPPLPATALLALPLRGMKLVVLSACESGVVQVRISNEIYGFPWALLAGGAENAVTSRWRVDGASNGKWMQSFYSAIASGWSPAEAAAAAARAVKKDEGNPYFWAAMQVSGR
jgi:CHAT domain-containing protein